MIVFWLLGEGFWTPLNLIAHTFWRSVPTDATFSVTGLVLGLIVHMMVSMLFGLVIAAAAGRLRMSLPLLVVAGAVFMLIVWVIMQLGVWRVIDPVAAREFTPWVFAVGHVMYGAVAAAVVAPLAKVTTSRRGA
ncbi:hypothetical protein GCM10022205_10880 [Spinactinospora alkalitolerans]